MIEEILPNLYKIKVPLPQSPLKAINSYVIKTDNRTLIVDTGMNREECLEVLSSGLKKLNVDLTKTDFFITHLHADHLGLVSVLATETSVIYFSKEDAAIFKDSGYWDEVIDFARANGFAEEDLQKAIKNHPGRKYSSSRQQDFHFLKDGDTISIGDYYFRCIATPGHTDGHLCLYEPNRLIFFSGDHLLLDITSNISLWNYENNLLDDYLKSLDKVSSLDVKLVLPGHRRPFSNFKERIQELKHHHQLRADEVLHILEKGEQNAVQVASQMTWDISYENWDLFPSQQKWFAFGEAVAHLKYLEEKGRIRKRLREQKIVFSLT